MPKKKKRAANRRRNRDVDAGSDPCWFMYEADSHGGHKLGLCNPNALLMTEDGDEVQPQLGTFQEYVWPLRIEAIQSIVDLAAGDEIIVGEGGDITHGKKYPEQLFTDSVAEQVQIAFHNMLPLVDLPNVKTVRLIHGTGSHVLGQGSTEIIVAQRLQERFGDKDIKPLAHVLLNIRGKIFDVAHHGPGAGIRQWTRGNVARHYLRSKVWQDYKCGNRPPDVYLRAHYHTFVWETIRERFDGEMREIHLIVMPSWCGMTEYARQATHSEFELTNGLVAFKIANGNLTVHPRVTTLDLRVRETL